MLANGTTEFVQLLLQFENTEPPVDDEEAPVSFTVLVEAVAEPIKTIADFAVPGCLLFPVDLLNVP